jgi:transcriptional regulator with XRE-family HTH domain
MGNRETNAADIHVGRRVHTARLAKGISQGALGSAVGVSFQQIQKYENGTNRIGTGRLHEIGQALDVPLAYFFEGIGDSSKKYNANAAMTAITRALDTPEGVRIAIALSAIENAELRRRIAGLLEEIIANDIQKAR